MSLVGGMAPPRDEPLVVNVGQLAKFPRLVILDRDDKSPTGFCILELSDLSIEQLNELYFAIVDYGIERRLSPLPRSRPDVVTIAPLAAGVVSRSDAPTIEIHPHLDAL